MQKLIRLTTGFLLLVAIFVMDCGGKAVPLTKAEEESDAKKVGRIFEMRTYHCNDGKLDELQARFRNHTNKLFAKHGMEVVGYWVSIDEKDTFFYILAFPDKEASNKSWKAFMSDPDWQKAYADSIVNGNLIKSVKSQFMTPADYSPIE
ncbi:MAG: NIPSNAP family protein [Candidatus Poribacteria bacterium]|nr:NIPSNAP family protein [Candidatus Poribacteria bacterium]MDP6745461.1 NIPSNAP family protein [Candidatus Poribacteria bacterium]MDP6995590.1 NIPSNAP family protein [Candidatus Poribacteria bacterium]